MQAVCGEERREEGLAVPIDGMNYEPRSGEIIYRLTPSKEEGRS